VRFGDGRDDREAQPAAAVLAGASPLAVELLKRLEQPGNLGRRDDGAAVHDRQAGTGGGRLRTGGAGDSGADLDVAAALVVPDGVVHQVGDEALDERRVAGDDGGLQTCFHADALVSGGGQACGDDPAGDPGEVERRGVLQSALAGGQGEQRVDEALGLTAEFQHLLAGGPQRLRARVRVGERDLQHGALCREGGAQLVGRVRDEVPLRPERRLQPGEQAVEGVAEFVELGVGLCQVQPAVQAARGGCPGGGGDGPQRAQRPGGDQPAEGERYHGEDGQRDRGVLQHLGQVVEAPLRCWVRAGGVHLAHAARLGQRQVGEDEQHQPGAEQQARVQQRQARAEMALAPHVFAGPGPPTR
jgi:hypothetical protein